MHAMKSPVFLFLLSSSLLAGAIRGQSEKVTLRFAATPDTTVFLVVTTTMAQNIDMGGQSMEMSNTVHQTLAAKVLSADDKGVKVEFEVCRTAGSMTMPMMGDVEFDSWTQKNDKEASDEEGDDFGMPNMDAIGKMMTSAAGRKFVATVDARGEITAIDGVKEAVEAAKQKGGGMGRMMRGLVSEDSLRQVFAATLLRCPAEAVVVGGQWERSEKRSADMPLDNKIKATLERVADDQVTLKIEGTVSKPPDEAGKGEAKGEKTEGETDEEASMRKEMMEKMTITDGSVTGSVTASRKDGFLLSGKSVTKMTMTMPSPMGGGEMTIESEVSNLVKRVTKEETQKPADKKPTEADKADAGK
jgi:hypothetical protein